MSLLAMVLCILTVSLHLQPLTLSSMLLSNHLKNLKGVIAMLSQEQKQQFRQEKKEKIIRIRKTLSEMTEEQRQAIAD
ncbi:MAG: hypothetical protein AB1394_16250, partial [Bacteroidota bacterium]